MNFVIEITKQLKVEAETKEELYQKIKEIEKSEDDPKNETIQVFGNEVYPVLLAKGILDNFNGTEMMDNWFVEGR